MWLLNAQTLKLKLIPRSSDYKDKYAILSHTWSDDEVAFQDMRKGGKPEERKGWLKIRYASRQAVKDGLRYLWVDTCCIDKTNSAELSEAINSMYRFYYNAKVCYAYVSDIPKGHRWSSTLEGPELVVYLDETRRRLAGCRWITRSWTLQELIAPSNVELYNEGWQLVGTKKSVVDQLSAVTGIDEEVLKDRDKLHTVSIAQRLSWAAERQSSREEDLAYSLLGLCDVHIPMLYGEGSRAFLRLQEEIVRTTLDHSVLAWEPWRDATLFSDSGLLFSSSPYGFRKARDIISWTVPERDESFELSNKGLRITLPTLQRGNELEALLNCRHAGQFLRPIALRLQVLPGRNISPWKPSTNTVCYMKPVLDVDGSALSHLTTLNITGLHGTQWLELVIAKQKPSEETVAKTKKVIVQRTKTFKAFDVLSTCPEEHWNGKESFMSFPVGDSGSRSEAFLVLLDRASSSLITLAFAHEMKGKTSSLKHCLVNHQDHYEPRAFASHLLATGASSAHSKTALSAIGKTLCATSQHMFLMGEMVWLMLLSAE